MQSWTYMLHAQIFHSLHAQQTHTRLGFSFEDWRLSARTRSNEKQAGRVPIGARNSLSKTLATPSFPPAPSPKRAGRPMPTPLAPRHSALTTSVPLLMPPSTH